MTTCILVQWSRCFERICCFHLQDRRARFNCDSWMIDSKLGTTIYAKDDLHCCLLDIACDESAHARRGQHLPETVWKVPINSLYTYITQRRVSGVTSGNTSVAGSRNINTWVPKKPHKISPHTETSSTAGFKKLPAFMESEILLPYQKTTCPGPTNPFRNVTPCFLKIHNNIPPPPAAGFLTDLFISGSWPKLCIQF